MFEAIEGYKKLTENNLFDPDSMLNKAQMASVRYSYGRKKAKK